MYLCILFSLSIGIIFPCLCVLFSSCLFAADGMSSMAAGSDAQLSMSVEYVECVERVEYVEYVEYVELVELVECALTCRCIHFISRFHLPPFLCKNNLVSS